MLRIPASEWIAKFDAAREKLLGEVKVIETVPEPPDFRDYPLGRKCCASCGRPSRSAKLPLDGKNFYCNHPTCRARREQRTRFLKSGVVLV